MDAEHKSYNMTEELKKSEKVNITLQYQKHPEILLKLVPWMICISWTGIIQAAEQYTRQHCKRLYRMPVWIVEFP